MLIGERVTILGAGIAGLTLARALALRGAKVIVLEQAAAISEAGAGLQISPNGLAVLRALGLDPGPGAWRSEAVELRNGADDALVARLPMQALRPRQDWRLVHRADLIALLEQGARAAGVEIRLLQRIEAAGMGPEGPWLRSAQGAQMQAGLVIGADGLHSVIRRALLPQSKPFFTGQVAWRALIPAAPGAEAKAEIHMGPGRHLVSYPLRGGTLRNIVAVEERRSWTEEGWSQPDDPAHLRAAFAGFSPKVQGWLSQVEACWLWGLFRHPVATRWGAVAEGNPLAGLALIGDAAHPTLPFLAQGANMALEDAWVLAEALSGTDSLAAALQLYQNRRMARVTRVVAAASANARNYHLRSPAREAAHLALRLASRFTPGLLVGRYDWIHAHDVTGAER
ncbi:FAD-dependent monooxygenase [Falsigemmobacter faecalis]|uniref:Monooxygenase n=1 Tax=Falsigemmobacter faecalis TaxID=2488730 RepID=A0A3P3DRW1_9RHOB|nr:FAD-dependent monooxygenase [Falsigemmobacter faecalis]RRH76426.1 monooxygenase [Falsigemmobacter faecalis]